MAQLGCSQRCAGCAGDQSASPRAWHNFSYRPLNVRGSGAAESVGCCVHHRIDQPSFLLPWVGQLEQKLYGKDVTLNCSSVRHHKSVRTKNAFKFPPGYPVELECVAISNENQLTLYIIFMLSRLLSTLSNASYNYWVVKHQEFAHAERGIFLD